MRVNANDFFDNVFYKNIKEYETNKQWKKTNDKHIVKFMVLLNRLEKEDKILLQEILSLNDRLLKVQSAISYKLGYISGVKYHKEISKKSKK